MYVYCEVNDILVKASSMSEAKDYAKHRLSPAYGHAPGRDTGLNLKRISAAMAERLQWSAITWEVD